jgi:hypothetical protein
VLEKLVQLGNLQVNKRQDNTGGTLLDILAKAFAVRGLAAAAEDVLWKSAQ